MEQVSVGNKDIDWDIFTKLPDKDVISLCLVSKEMSKLCKDESFWEARVRWFFPGRKKPGYMNWKSYYGYLITHPIEYVFENQKIFDEEAIKLDLRKRHYDTYIRDPMIGDIFQFISIKRKSIHYVVTEITEDVWIMRLILYRKDRIIQFPNVMSLDALGLSYFKDYIKRYDEGMNSVQFGGFVRPLKKD